MIFELTGGDLSQLAAAWRLTKSFAYEWLYLKRQKTRAELEVQAALHGVKLVTPPVSDSRKELNANLGKSRTMAQKGNKVSTAEKARRKALRLRSA